MKSQTQRLKEHFFSGKSITRLSAFKDVGIFELSARIKELERDGFTIHRKWVKVTNRFEEQVRIKEYRLKPYD